MPETRRGWIDLNLKKDASIPSKSAQNLFHEINT